MVAVKKKKMKLKNIFNHQTFCVPNFTPDIPFESTGVPNRWVDTPKPSFVPTHRYSQCRAQHIYWVKLGEVPSWITTLGENTTLLLRAFVDKVSITHKVNIWWTPCSPQVPKGNNVRVKLLWLFYASSFSLLLAYRVKVTDCFPARAC